MSGRLERAATSLLTVAALCVAAAAVRREFFAPRTSGSAIPEGPPEFVAGWEQIVDNGHLIGDARAPIKLIEFGDFECPFCKRYQPRLASTLQRFSPKVAAVYVHLPLRNHRFAMPSARASECAAEQQRFGEMADALYSAQDSLGLKPWTAIARTAGVTDTGRFALCLSRPTAFPRIDSGLAIAARLGVRGTPTIIVNGWRFPVAPTDAEMDRVISALLDGKKPF